MQDIAHQPTKDALAPDIGQTLRQIRKSNGISLAALAQDVSVSEATLSRIETGRTDATAAVLYRLAARLNVEITIFFAAEPTPLHSGTRSVMRRGDGAIFRASGLQAKVLCAELSNKSMHPYLNHVSAKTIADAGGLNSHEGEEFLFVIQGILILHSQAYAPLHLEKGEAVYFDATQPHAYVTGDQKPAEILVITSAGLPAVPSGLASNTQKDTPQ
ncbi:MAG: transcriptional regulator with XRE-family HTH domain [Paracoccaceae bacterium]|jgi:transcriptional regulator with XRE-family HTH domain